MLTKLTVRTIAAMAPASHPKRADLLFHCAVIALLLEALIL